MTEDELSRLETFLLSAIEGGCIPEWELEALLGCSRNEARELVGAALRGEGEVDSGLLDQLVILLSALAGSVQLMSRVRPHEAIDLLELQRFLARLLGVHTELPDSRHRRAPDLQSQIKLRVPQPAAAEKKRPA
jgi:hypothetical protein